MFDQDAHLVLGAGVADEVTSQVAELGVGLAQSRLQPRQGLQGRLGPDLQVHEALGVLAHDLSQDRERLAATLHDAQHLQRAEDAVARGGIVGEDQVTGVLPAEGVASRAQGLDDVAVAHRGREDGDPGRAQGLMQSQVAHHRAGHRRSAQFPLLHQGQRAQRQDPVAGHARPGLVGEDHAIGVAVEGNPEVGALLADDPSGMVGMQGPAPLVDVQAIRFDAELHDLGAQFLEDEGREQVGRAVTAVHDDLHPGQIAGADALFRVFDVATAGVVDAGRLADLIRAHPGDFPLAQDFPLDRQLQFVGKLVAIGSEDLEAIVLIRVVGRRQHDPRAATHRLRQVRHPGRRHRADEEHVHAAGDESAGQRRLEHVAGDARVLADDDAVVVGAIGFKNP